MVPCEQLVVSLVPCEQLGLSLHVCGSLEQVGFSLLVCGALGAAWGQLCSMVATNVKKSSLRIKNEDFFLELYFFQ